MKRNKEEMEVDSKEKYFQSPPIVRERKLVEPLLIVKQGDHNDNSLKMISVPDASIEESAAESTKTLIADSEADAIYKRLKSESESQAALKM